MKDAAIQQSVTIETVHSLQRRAPEVSTVDRAYISQVMDDGAIFPSVVGTKRKAVKDAILRLKVIIPSIKSLHENIKYLALGSMVLKDKIFDKSLRTTIRQTAFDHWTPPSTLLVQVGNNCTIQYHNLEKMEMWDLSYKQMWLLLFRNFPELSGVPPRKETGDGSDKEAGLEMTPDTVCEGKSLMAEQELVNLVLSLGIKTRKIVRLSALDPKLETLYKCVSSIYSTKSQTWRKSKAEEMLCYLQNQPEAESTKDTPVEVFFSAPEGECLERRWGRPFQFAHISNKNLLYLPNLVESSIEEPDSMPTSIYVQRDLVDAFFGKTSPKLFVQGPTLTKESTSEVYNADEILNDLDGGDILSSVLHSPLEIDTEADMLVYSEENLIDMESHQEQSMTFTDQVVFPQRDVVAAHGKLPRELQPQRSSIKVPETDIGRVQPLTTIDDVIPQNSSSNLERPFSTQVVTEPRKEDKHSEISNEPTSTKDISLQMEQRTPIQLIYDLPATVNSHSARDITKIPVSNATRSNISSTCVYGNPQAFIIQEESRTPIQSIYNLSATITTLPDQGVTTQQGTQAPWPLESLRTPIISDKPTTLNLKPMNHGIFETNSDHERFRTPIQSIFNLPATTTVAFNNERQVKLPQEKFRTPIQSIYNLPATTKSLLHQASECVPAKPEMTEGLNNSQDGLTVSSKITDESLLQPDAGAKMRIISKINRNSIRNTGNILEYNGLSIVPKSVSTREDYLQQRKQWYLFGGTSPDQGFIIPPNKRAWYIQKYPAWTFVFVPRRFGELWKRDGAKIIRRYTFEKKGNTRHRQPTVQSQKSLEPLMLEDNPQHRESVVGSEQHCNKLISSIRCQGNQELASQLGDKILEKFSLAQVASSSRHHKGKAILNYTVRRDLDWKSLASHCQRYSGQSLLTAESDLREIVKPHLQSWQTAFLVYNSPDEWNLLQFQEKFEFDVHEAIAANYFAFTFTSDRESLKEILIDFRMSDKAEHFALWIVAKSMRAQFLAHRNRSFDEEALGRYKEFTIEAGTYQQDGEHMLFEDSDFDSGQEGSLNFEEPKTSRLSNPVKMNIDMPTALPERVSPNLENAPPIFQSKELEGIEKGKVEISPKVVYRKRRYSAIED